MVSVCLARDRTFPLRSPAPLDVGSCAEVDSPTRSLDWRSGACRMTYSPTLQPWRAPTTALIIGVLFLALPNVFSNLPSSSLVLNHNLLLVRTLFIF